MIKKWLPVKRHALKHNPITNSHARIQKQGGGSFKVLVWFSGRLSRTNFWSLCLFIYFRFYIFYIFYIMGHQILFVPLTTSRQFNSNAGLRDLLLLSYSSTMIRKTWIDIFPLFHLKLIVCCNNALKSYRGKMSPIGTY